MRTPIIAGNWKMNRGTTAEATELAKAVLDALAALNIRSEIEVVLCPPVTALTAVGNVIDHSLVRLGAQDVFWREHGAYTGQVSAAMLVDAGVRYVIIGHSERRGRFGVAEPDFTHEIMRHFGETDATVNLKTKAALAGNLIPIICVGETLTERETGETDDIIRTQVADALVGIESDQAGGLVFAYEPVWAIGTGKVCDVNEANRICGIVREAIETLYDTTIADAVRIQYGGSMKPDNAASLLAESHIDGGLVGGASLKAHDFAMIVQAANA